MKFLRGEGAGKPSKEMCKVCKKKECVNFYTFFYNIYTRVCKKSSNFAA